MSDRALEPGPHSVLVRADELRRDLGEGFRDQMVASLYSEAQRIAARAVRPRGESKWDLDQRIDRLVTSPIFGLPLMLLVLSVIFWITIIGANYPSQALANLFFWWKLRPRTCSGDGACRGGSPVFCGMEFSEGWPG